MKTWNRSTVEKLKYSQAHLQITDTKNESNSTLRVYLWQLYAYLATIVWVELLKISDIGLQETQTLSNQPK